MRILTILALAAAAALQAQPPSAALHYDSGVPQIRFAATEIHRAFAERGTAVAEADLARPAGATLAIYLASGPGAARLAASLGLSPAPAAGPQSYSVRVKGSTYAVLAADPAGALYGGLDLAEAIRLGTLATLKDSDHKAYIAQRGIKFNVPLDVRTPSYSDSGDAGQQNIPEMWSFDFWRAFLDEMARHRYNVLSLWNLHPFPSMVKVPEYPDVALDDVQRTTVKLDDTFSSRGVDMTRPEMLKSVEVVKRIPIGEKIGFWRDVMQYAADRGISVYVFTWNIFTFGNGSKYGITPAQDNPVTIDYYRKSIREMVLTYPLLAGMGVTAGEQMSDRKDEFSKENWLWRTYGEGVRDALKLQPGRDFRLIHRYHETALKPILEAFKEYPSTFDLSYKYSVAHMLSSPAPIFAKEALAELPPNLKLWMTVRSDDTYNFRWGDPEYARAYIKNLPGPDKLNGFYMGPDGYVLGREFVSTEPETPREPVISKQWFYFMLFGRLSYEPSLDNSLFERTFAQKFPDVPSAKVLEASEQASRIIPQITRFFWGDIDLKWFPEACLSHPRYRGFYTVKHFMEGETMPGAGVLNIRGWRDRVVGGKPMDGITPPQVAEALERYAAATLTLVSELRPAGQTSKELRLTLGDYEAMAHLGNYYAEKIRGASQLALFDRTGDAARKQEAVAHLKTALEQWNRYASVAGSQYKPQLLNRVGYVDLKALAAKVSADIRIAEEWKPNTTK